MAGLHARVDVGVLRAEAAPIRTATAAAGGAVGVSTRRRLGRIPLLKYSVASTNRGLLESTALSEEGNNFTLEEIVRN